MAELRAGGLAIIIRSRHPENVGKVVKLAAYAGEINHPLGRGVYWRLEAMSELAGAPCRIKSGSMGMALARNLMPIDGNDFSNEKE
ncbi:hypothetical protein [Klebsiella pasteurii]|uniref:hypothetical protein n=1 Tax=Klebsiella pasteurii TaxID=2587529 RepID=UPI00115F5DEB|nr:hypothetical protein [Klebsiella pasteurii]VUS34322.1 hypothetical protein SB6420_01024 [Klebsiella pasteurii]